MKTIVKLFLTAIIIYLLYAKYINIINHYNIIKHYDLIKLELILKELELTQEEINHFKCAYPYVTKIIMADKISRQTRTYTLSTRSTKDKMIKIETPFKKVLAWYNYPPWWKFYISNHNACKENK